jgi:hypothetical protein
MVDSSEGERGVFEDVEEVEEGISQSDNQVGVGRWVQKGSDVPVSF